MVFAISTQTAKLVFKRGDVTATNSSLPGPRKLSKGSLLEPGDLVKTGPKGLAQVLLPDATLLILKNSSEVKLEQFHFDSKDKTKDNIAVNLIKGTLRTFSGKIGKRSPKKVSYKTEMATIGIRGTVVRFELTDSGELKIHFITGEGSITDPNNPDKVVYEFVSGNSDPIQVNSLSEPLPTSWPLPENDPSKIFLDLLDKPSEEITVIVEEANASLSEEDKIVLMAMDGQAETQSGEDVGSTIMKALASQNDSEITGTILSIATEINTDKAEVLVQSSIEGGMPPKEALTSVLSGMGSDDVSTEQISEVIKVAIDTSNEVDSTEPLTTGQAYDALIDSVNSTCQ